MSFFGFGIHAACRLTIWPELQLINILEVLEIVVSRGSQKLTFSSNYEGDDRRGYSATRECPLYPCPDVAVVGGKMPGYRRVVARLGGSQGV
jgi:hypothetical protein